MLLDLVLPRRCVVCRLLGTLLCDACRARLPRFSGTACLRCGAPTAWPVERCRECAGRRIAFASARAAVAYEGAAQALVTGWKQRALRGLAAVAADVLVETLPRPRADAIAAVPPDGDRSLLRGHHPPDELARELARRWEIPAQPLLRRARPLRPQRGLSLAERRRNVRGGFEARANTPARVLVVDDVYTTGATANEAARALRAAGASRIEVMTFARAVR